MKNYSTAKTNNVFIDKLSTFNLTALSIFLIYFSSITLLPIANGIINVRHNNLFITAQSKNISLQQQVLKLKTSSANTIATATYINNGQMLARQIDDSNLQSYINDAKGSILKLNNSDGTNAQNYNYDAYGKLIIAKSAQVPRSNLTFAVTNPFQYNGERFDNNTALQYLRARFYNPEIKRFVNQDSYNLLNRFAYANANPVMVTDPTGHDAKEWLGYLPAIAAAALFAGITAYTTKYCHIKRGSNNSNEGRPPSSSNSSSDEISLAGSSDTPPDISSVSAMKTEVDSNHALITLFGTADAAALPSHLRGNSQETILAAPIVRLDYDMSKTTAPKANIILNINGKNESFAFDRRPANSELRGLNFTKMYNAMHYSNPEKSISLSEIFYQNNNETQKKAAFNMWLMQNPTTNRQIMHNDGLLSNPEGNFSTEYKSFSLAWDELLWLANSENTDDFGRN